MAVEDLGETGKTSLTREFYSGILENDKYWQSIKSTAGVKELEVISSYNKNSLIEDLAFFSSRSIDNQGYNYDFTFNKLRQQFTTHLLQIVKSIANKI